jgi:hypothetical protein
LAFHTGKLGMPPFSDYHKVNAQDRIVRGLPGMIVQSIGWWMDMVGDCPDDYGRIGLPE